MDGFEKLNTMKVHQNVVMEVLSVHPLKWGYPRD
jgi:hypothetical protein